MKKHEVNRQKRKLKQLNHFRTMKLAQYMCVALVLLFLVYMGLLSTQTEGGFNALLKDNLFTTVGFIVCVVNLYVFYDLKRLMKTMESFQDIEATRLELMLITVAQLVLFNYASAALLVISLVKYFKWRPFSFKQMFKEISKTKKWSSILITAVILMALIALAFVVIIAAINHQ